MAPRKMKKQVALKRKRKNIMKVKAEIRNIADEQKCIREGQRKVREKFEEIERECHQLKAETEIIMKQRENVLLKFKILKARQFRDSLREFVTRKRKKQVALKPKMENIVKLKAEMRKIADDQNCIREEQRKVREKFGQIERECHQLKEETEIIMKQTTRAQVKLALMFKILKACQDRDFIRAATLTHCLREFVAKERANASLLTKVKDANP